MPAEEPIQNLPAPINSDPPDGPTQIAAVNAAVVNRLNMRFASVAARDAALPNPVDGMEAMTGSGPSAVKWIYVNNGWRFVWVGEQDWTPLPTTTGWSSSGKWMLRAGWAMLDINITPTSEWGGGTVVGVTLSDTDRWMSNEATNDTRFTLTAGGGAVSGRMFRDGSINAYGSPALSPGATIRGSISYPIRMP